MKGGIKSVFTYGFQKEPKIRHFIYSFIVTSLYFVGVGIPILFGYTIKIAKRISVDQNKEIPPSYRPYKPLIRDGMTFLIYAVVLIGIPAVGVFATNTLVTDNVASGALSTTDAAILNGVVIGLFIATIGGTFLLPAMICGFIVTGEWGAGFKFKLMEKIVMRKKYIKLYFKFMILSVVAGFIAQFLFALVFVAPIGVLAWFIYLVTFGRLLGDYCSYIKQKDLDTS